MEASGQRYLSEVKRSMVCAKEDRERLLADAGEMLQHFSQENPGAFYEDYVSAFGPPEEFARELLGRLDPVLVEDARRRRRGLRWAAVVAASAAVLFLAAFLFGRWSQPAPAPAVESAAPAPAETVAPTPAETAAPTPAETAAPTPAVSEMPAVTEPPAADFAQRARDYVAQLSDGEEIQYPEAVAAVIKLGIMSGKEDGSYFDPAGNITRGEAAKLLATVMNGGRELPSGIALKETPSFPDIGGHWAESYIEYCFDMGMAFGDTDGNFDPNGNITGMELVRMLLCALGYNADAYKLVGEDWAARTHEAAMTAAPYGLYDGLSGMKTNDPVTREVAVQLIYNTLRSAPMMVFPVQIPGGTVAWEYKNGTNSDGTLTTLLQQRFDMRSFEEIEF